MKQAHKEVFNEYQEYRELLKAHQGVWYPMQNPLDQGEHGILLEKLVGIEANNSKTADLGLCELKTVRIPSRTRLTFLTQAFSNSSDFAKTYVSPRGKFNATIGTAKFTNSRANPVNLKLHLEDDRVNLYIKDKATSSLLSTGDYSWSKELLMDRFDRKMKNLILTNYKVKNESGHRFVTYGDTKLLLLDSKRFWEMIRDNQVKVDIRMGIHMSGANVGKPHDHGTAFRVTHNDLKNMVYKEL